MKVTPDLMVFIQEKILSKIKGGANIINLDQPESIGTQWIAFYVHDNNITYFDSFGV